jgi:hypothetical protein
MTCWRPYLLAGTKLSGAGQIRSSNHLQAAAGAAEREREFTGETLSDKFQALNVSIVQASAKILEAVHEIPKILKQPQSKRASDCGSRDYLLFHIQQQKTLEICTLDDKLYQTYKRVLRNQDKFRVILDEQEIDCSLATAWQVLSFKEEVQQMHPVTAKFLEEVLRIHSSQFHFRIDREVGFSTTYQDDDQVFMASVTRQHILIAGMHQARRNQARKILIFTAVQCQYLVLLKRRHFTKRKN